MTITPTDIFVLGLTFCMFVLIVFRVLGDYKKAVEKRNLWKEKEENKSEPIVFRSRRRQSRASRIRKRKAIDDKKS